jgi:hypothetical protein
MLESLRAWGMPSRTALGSDARAWTKSWPFAKAGGSSGEDLALKPMASSSSSTPWRCASGWSRRRSSPMGDGVLQVFPAQQVTTLLKED